MELGRIGIMIEVSCLSRNLFSTCEGHLKYVYIFFEYLQKNISKNPGRIAFDPACVHTDENLFKMSTRKLGYWK